MTTVTQTLNVAYVPPPLTAAWPVADTANSKAKVIGYPISPVFGSPLTATWQLNRALTGATLSKLLTVPSNPLTATVPSAQAGFALYRQCPTLGLARNLATNGGFLSGAHDWIVNATTVTYVADALSVTGYAARFVALTTEYSGHYQVLFIEAGKAYSLAAQLRSDGAKQIYLQIDWLDATGALISSASSSVVTSTAYTEAGITNSTAPSNANRARIFAVLNGAAGSAGIGYATAFRFMQQTTAPAAWVPSHQQYVQRGYWSSSTAATASLLTNPDIETAVSSNVDGFNDSLANLNQWVSVLGSTFTVAANLVSNAAGSGNRMLFGNPDWWDAPAGSRLRFKWVTSGVFYWMLHYVDTSNYTYLKADGATFSLRKNISSVDTLVNSQTAVLTTGNFYWIQPTISGTSFSSTLENDTAGAPGTNVATITAQTISDAIVQTGAMAVQMDGGTGMQFGGNFASVVRVKIPAVTGWTPTQVAGLSAFAVSKVLPFAGTYSLSIMQRNAADDAHWLNAYTSGTSTLRSVAGRAKVANGGGTGAYVQVVGAATNATNALTGTVDWTVINRSAVTDTVATGYRCRMTGVGQAWFDNLWLVAEAFDTINYEPSGSSSAVMPRPVSSCTLPLPTGFNLADFARVDVVRFESAYNANLTFRTIWKYVIDANNTIELYVDKPTGQIVVLKSRSASAIGSSITDGGATAFAAGDTLVIGVRHSATVGLELQVSKNGGAPVVSTTSTLEAKSPLSGTATSYFGWNGTAQQLDGTVAADTTLKAGLTSAQLTAWVANPYGDPDDNTLALWGSEGVIYQVPVWDDRCLKLGTAYDWSVDATNSGTNVTTAFGYPTTTTVAQLLDSWWIRSVEDSTKDLKLPVVDQYDFDTPKDTFTASPLVGGPKIVISAPAAYGDEFGLKLLYTSVTDQNIKEAALKLLLNDAASTLYLQDQFGGLRKVAFVQSEHFTKHETFLDAELHLIEVL